MLWAACCSRVGGRDDSFFFGVVVLGDTQVFGAENLVVVAQIMYVGLLWDCAIRWACFYFQNMFLDIYHLPQQMMGIVI